MVMKMDSDNYLGEIGVVLLGIVLAVTIIPLLCGVGVAVLFGVTGLAYFSVVMSVACLIWAWLWLLWWN